MGVCQGIANENIAPHKAFKAIEYWLSRYFGDKIDKIIKHRDPSFEFESPQDNLLNVFSEWGVRVKNGKFLQPVPGASMLANTLKLNS